MNILQIDRTEMSTPLGKHKLGLLINVHLADRCDDVVLMRKHAVELLRKENVKKYAGVSVVYWLQREGRRERLYMHDFSTSTIDPPRTG